MTFLLTIENYDPDCEQLQELIADALDGSPAYDEARTIDVIVEPAPDCVQEIARLQHSLLIAQQIVGKQTNWLEAIREQLTEALRVYPTV
jgi:hypothetical protein